MKKALFASRHCSYSLLFILAVGSVARAQDFSGRIVTSVQYDPERQPIDPRDLQNAQLVRAGERLDLKQVAGTIDRLFATGLYENIQVDAEPSENGVSLRFITRSRRFIGHVDAEGDISDPPSRSVILSEAELSLGAPFDADALNTARK